MSELQNKIEEVLVEMAETLEELGKEIRVPEIQEELVDSLNKLGNLLNPELTKIYTIKFSSTEDKENFKSLFDQWLELAQPPYDLIV